MPDPDFQNSRHWIVLFLRLSSEQSANKCNDKQYKKNVENDLRNIGCTFSDSSESKDGGNNCNDQKDYDKSYHNKKF